MPSTKKNAFWLVAIGALVSIALFSAYVQFLPFRSVADHELGRLAATDDVQQFVFRTPSEANLSRGLFLSIRLPAANQTREPAEKIGRYRLALKDGEAPLLEWMGTNGQACNWHRPVAGVILGEPPAGTWTTARLKADSTYVLAFQWLDGVPTAVNLQGAELYYHYSTETSLAAE